MINKRYLARGGSKHKQRQTDENRRLNVLDDVDQRLGLRQVLSKVFLMFRQICARFHDQTARIDEVDAIDRLLVRKTILLHLHHSQHRDTQRGLKN